MSLGPAMSLLSLGPGVSRLSLEPGMCMSGGCSLRGGGAGWGLVGCQWLGSRPGMGLRCLPVDASRLPAAGSLRPADWSLA